MLAYRILFRHTKLTNSYKILLSNTYCTSSDSDDGKSKKTPKAKVPVKDDKKSGEALLKLNILLKKMIEDEPQKATKSKLNLARPFSKFRNAQKEPGTISVQNEPVEKQVMNAAKNVAESLGGNIKQTESELLSKLLGTSQQNQNEPQAKPMNLSDLISGMKIDRTVKPPSSTGNEESRAHQVRQILDRSSHQRGRGDGERNTISRVYKKPTNIPKAEIQRTNLFGGETFGIFTKKTSETEENVKLRTWKALHERELRLAVTHPPENYFQELILWTQQGKVWKFPIDNEQGMEEEHNVYFTEHIFLDKHLEPWCPQKGPVRHFMELVCVGLSKNPYISVQAKKEHIEWFREYFMSKKQLLEETGAIPSNTVKVEQIGEK